MIIPFILLSQWVTATVASLDISWPNEPVQIESIEKPGLCWSRLEEPLHPVLLNPCQTSAEIADQIFLSLDELAVDSRGYLTYSADTSNQFIMYSDSTIRYSSDAGKCIALTVVGSSETHVTIALSVQNCLPSQKSQQFKLLTGIKLVESVDPDHGLSDSLTEEALAKRDSPSSSSTSTSSAYASASSSSSSTYASSSSSSSAYSTSTSTSSAYASASSSSSSAYASSSSSSSTYSTSTSTSSAYASASSSSSSAYASSSSSSSAYSTSTSTSSAYASASSSSSYAYASSSSSSSTYSTSTSSAYASASWSSSIIIASPTVNSDALPAPTRDAPITSDSVVKTTETMWTSGLPTASATSTIGLASTVRPLTTSTIECLSSCLPGTCGAISDNCGGLLKCGPCCDPRRLDFGGVAKNEAIVEKAVAIIHSIRGMNAFMGGQTVGLMDSLCLNMDLSGFNDCAVESKSGPSLCSSPNDINSVYAMECILQALCSSLSSPAVAQYIPPTDVSSKSPGLVFVIPETEPVTSVMVSYLDKVNIPLELFIQKTKRGALDQLQRFYFVLPKFEFTTSAVIEFKLSYTVCKNNFADGKCAGPSAIRQRDVAVTPPELPGWTAPTTTITQTRTSSIAPGTTKSFKTAMTTTTTPIATTATTTEPPAATSDAPDLFINCT
ncbi:hypothetical protein BDR26DRAFT_1007152 [Obelidium mucronatum]|nr:hypothetical protein BDR26DRAFT_1007152 [Obelidium mucronatum]